MTKPLARYKAQSFVKLPEGRMIMTVRGLELPPAFLERFRVAPGQRVIHITMRMRQNHTPDATWQPETAQPDDLVTFVTHRWRLKIQRAADPRRSSDTPLGLIDGVFIDTFDYSQLPT